MDETKQTSESPILTETVPEEPVKANYTWLFAGITVFVIVTVVWGIGRAFSRAEGWEQAPWASVVLLGLILGGYALRRLRWWLLLVLPVAWLGMSATVTSVELAVQPTVSSLTRDDSVCERQGEFADGLNVIAPLIQSWQMEYSTAPSIIYTATYAGWADDWREIGQHYRNLPAAEGTAEYRRLAIQAADYYADAFGQFAENNAAEGRALLAQAEATIERARNAFQTARVPTCAGR